MTLLEARRLVSLGTAGLVLSILSGCLCRASTHERFSQADRKRPMKRSSRREGARMSLVRHFAVSLRYWRDDVNGVCELRAIATCAATRVQEVFRSRGSVSCIRRRLGLA